MVRNVVLLVLDTVRKDYFDRYAPRLAERADIDVDRCYCASNWTVPSHASMLTGSLPHEHGVHACTPVFSKLDRSETLLVDLPDHRAVAVNANFTLNTKQGFRALFDEYVPVSFTRLGYLDGGVDLPSFAARHDGLVSKYVHFLRESVVEGEVLASLVNGLTAKLYETTGWLPGLPRLVDYGAKEVKRESRNAVAEEPVFLYANFMEAHMPHRSTVQYDRSLYSVPDSWSSYDFDNWTVNTASDAGAFATDLGNLRELYRAAIDYLDRQVVELVDEIETRTANETTVVVTSDHGENLGFDHEDGLVGHDAGALSEGLLHVPLLVFNPPDEFDLNERAPLTQLDFGELFRALVHEESPDLNRSLVPAERVCLPGRDSLADRLERFEYWDRAERCVYSGDTKHVWDSLGRTRRFSVGEQPSEQRPASSGSDLEGDAAFGRPLTEFKAEIDDRCGTDVLYEEDYVDPAVKERLRNLGYG